MTETTAQPQRVCAQCGAPGSEAQLCTACGGPIITRRPDTDPNIGRTLGGKYVLLARLGRGGFGAVYRARDERLDRLVAIKLLHVDIDAHPAALRRFHDEARNTSRLAHPNNVKVFDFGETDDGLVFIVMELLDGVALSRIDIPVRAVRALAMLRQIARALAEAHSIGLIHRDLKPDNVMVSVVDGADFVRVLDYGIAKLEDAATSVTAQGAFVGTPGYTSPEQLLGDPVDRRCDIYTFGLLAWELIAGRAPFVADDPIGVAVKHLQEAPPKLTGRGPLSPQLVELVTSCLAKRPDDRPQTMEDIILAIDMLPELKGTRLSHVDGSPTGPSPSAPWAVTPSTDDVSFDETVGFSGGFPAVDVDANADSATTRDDAAITDPTVGPGPVRRGATIDNRTVLAAIAVMSLVVIALIVVGVLRSRPGDAEAFDPSATSVPPPSIAALPDDATATPTPVLVVAADVAPEPDAAELREAQLLDARSRAAALQDTLHLHAMLVVNEVLAARVQAQEAARTSPRPGRTSAAARSAESRSDEERAAGGQQDAPADAEQERAPDAGGRPGQAPDPRDEILNLLGDD